MRALLMGMVPGDWRVLVGGLPVRRSCSCGAALRRSRTICTPCLSAYVTGE